MVEVAGYNGWDNPFWYCFDGFDTVLPLDPCWQCEVRIVKVHIYSRDWMSGVFETQLNPMTTSAF